MKTSLLLVAMSLCGFIHAQGKFFGGNGDGFATVTISNVVLPVEITHFAVAREAAFIKADLSIQSTESICGIVLERSTNGGHYTTIDSLTGLIPGSNFVFTDRQPSTADSYYRARISKCDGGFVFSKIVVLKTATIKDHFIIADAGIQYAIAKSGSLEIINSAGQPVYKRLLNAGTGRLAMPFLPGGIYFLRFDNLPAVRFLVK